jgi:decaprenylphospho-beta-D-ribofuranose 2-oxidase
VSDLDQLADAIEQAPSRGVIARGLGRSYGDVAQNAGGLVLDMTGCDEIHAFDRRQGIVTVAAGCSLERLLQVCLPAGWFLPVTPGTRFVTVGGAIACDVHGKNHHRDGALGQHVVSLTLLTPDGELRGLDPVGTPENFAATVGGLGLTGIMIDATLKLLPVETTMMQVDVERAADLDEALGRLAATDHLHRYSVAWIDCLDRGRAVLLRGDHAALDDVPATRRSMEALPASRIRIPEWAGRLSLPRTRAALAAFNELYFRRSRTGHGLLRPLGPFFYPLDALRDWNRLYGRGGFLQYQFVVPFGREDVLHSVMGLAVGARPPLLAVLKRFGDGGGPLSFPLRGWTVALDIPLPAPKLGPALDAADDLVAEAGGRVYLAKDSRLRRDHVAAMYPRLDEWRETQERLDPSGRMQCDLARRLALRAA